MASGKPFIGCSIQVLTHNNAGTIGACLESLREFGEVIVQDGYSTDGTKEIALKYPNVTFVDQNKKYLDKDGYITDFSSLRNETIQAAKYDWIFPVDADEILSPAEADEMRAIIERGTPGVYVSFRRFYLNGEKIDYCSGYPALQIRLFHRGLVIDGYRKQVHELLNMKPGITTQPMKAEHPVPLAPIEELMPKYDRYLQMELKRHGVPSYGHWFQWVFIRNLKTITVLTLRLLRIWLVPRKGKRMPLGYELIAYKYSLRVMWAMFPPNARKALQKQGLLK